MGKSSKRNVKIKRGKRRIDELDSNKADLESINIGTGSLDGDTLYDLPEVPPSASLWPDGIDMDILNIFDFSDFELGIDEDFELDDDDEWSEALARLGHDEEAYVTKKGNQVSHNNSEGLLIGGMNRRRKRVSSHSFGPDSHNSKAILFDLNASQPSVKIDRGKDNDHMDIDWINRKQSRGVPGLGLRGDHIHMDVGEGSSMHHAPKTLGLGFGGDHINVDGGSLKEQILGPLVLRLRSNRFQMDVGEDRSGQRTLGSLGLGLGGDHMDIGEGSSTPETLGLRLGGNHMDVGEGSSRQHTPGTLGLGKSGDHMNVGGGSLEERILGPLGLTFRSIRCQMDVGEGSSSQHTPGTLGLGLGGDHMYVGEGSSRQHTPGTLGLGLGGDHMDVGEGSSRQHGTGQER